MKSMETGRQDGGSDKNHAPFSVGKTGNISRKFLTIILKIFDKNFERLHYTLIRRGGFIDSQNLKDGPKRKKDIYVFAPGSCFKTTFSGQVEEEETGGEHSVFRYEKALFLGVNL